MRIGIVGASGYTGAELMRLCAAHPDFDVEVATGDSKAGSRIADLYPSLAAAYGDRTYDSYSSAIVDGLDLGILLGNWQQVAAPSGGELNGIDPVDSLDLGILLGAWNPPPLAGAAAVPEPTSALLLCAGMSLLVTMKRSRFVR